MPNAPLPKKATTRTQKIGLITGILVFVAMVISPAPSGITNAAWSVAALALLMMIWWMSEALPLAATALIPLVAVPFLLEEPIEIVAQAYAHPLVFMFLGGFLIASALERWDLHRRIAASVLRMNHSGLAGLIGALMICTAFLSMWITNTATAMVMMPIAKSLIQSMRSENTSKNECDTFAAALMLGIAFSATIGGMATLIGTPPNALLAAYVETAHGVKIGFGQWMLLGVPILIILLPVTWWLLTKFMFQLGEHSEIVLKRMIEDAQPASSTLSIGAKRVAIVAILAGLALIFRPLLETAIPALPLSDSGIVMTAALILFALPSGEPNEGRLLQWENAKSIRWDVLILFGGGLSLAAAIDSSGLSSTIGAGLVSLEMLPIALIILIAMATMVYLGEIASNTAMAAVFLPVAGAAAIELGVAPLELVLPIGLAASLGFMLPVATPPNAIVYGSGDVTAQQMLKTGAVLDVLAIFIVYAIAMILGPWVFVF
ncbi:MAG: DASS family sodium-coupled anion symporter [Rhizobiaceae bacterium]|nr:DASS family sodium-coupled anion symporter [Rhizobiaceae bacterium]